MGLLELLLLSVGLAMDAFSRVNMVAVRINRNSSGTTERLAFEALAASIVLFDLISHLPLEGFMVGNVHCPDLDRKIIAVLTERLDRENRNVGSGIEDDGFV